MPNMISQSMNICQHLIRPFPMLVATGSFSTKRGLLVIICAEFNHFKRIVMSTLLHSKTLKCSFLNNIMQLFHMLPTKISFTRHLYEAVI